MVAVVAVLVSSGGGCGWGDAAECGGGGSGGI